jgi:hypothetical protein
MHLMFNRLSLIRVYTLEHSLGRRLVLPRPPAPSLWAELTQHRGPTVSKEHMTVWGLCGDCVGTMWGLCAIPHVRVDSIMNSPTSQKWGGVGYSVEVDWECQKDPSCLSTFLWILDCFDFTCNFQKFCMTALPIKCKHDQST